MILDPILNPFLKMAPVWSILVISFIISVFITLVYKFMTNQTEMKQLKEDMKNAQKQAKQLKEAPQQAMAAQKRAMELNMKYMMKSLKPMLIYFIPLILVFGWLNAHYGFEPIKPNEYFTITLGFDESEQGEVELLAQQGIEATSSSVKQISNGKATWEATWELKGEAGDYILEFRHNDKTYTKQIIISEEQRYTAPIQKINGNAVKEISTNQKKLRVLFRFMDWDIGWLAAYIIFSMIFTLGIRKVLKVH